MTTRPDAGSLLDRIGNTPLVEIKRIFQSDRIRLLAKLEWFNPGGSVKDRPAYSMIRKGEESGELRPGKIIIDSTAMKLVPRDFALRHHIFPIAHIIHKGQVFLVAVKSRYDPVPSEPHNVLNPITGIFPFLN